MKQVILITLVMLLSAAAYGQTRQVSVNFNSTPFSKALDELSEKSGIRFAYSVNTVKGAVPVTMKQSGRFGRILNEILRLRGLESIQTGDKLLTLVPAESDEGLAKSVGRACRTIVRLELKLEKAVLEKDIVRVPGWSDEDDTELALQLADLFSVLIYCAEVNRAGFSKASDINDRLLRLIRSADPDVRAGAGMMQAFTGTRKWGNESKELFEIFLKEKDSIAKGMWLMALGERSIGGGFKQELIKEQKKAADSNSAELRFAAAVSLHASGGNPDGSKILNKLVMDNNIAVRIVSMLFYLNRPGKNQELAQKSDASLTEMRTSSNPIARSYSLIARLILSARNPVGLMAVISDSETTKDPWLRKCVSLVSPFVSMAMKQPPDFTGGEKLLFSEHRSDQLMGAGMLITGYFANASPLRKDASVPDPFKPAVEQYLKCLESDFVWSRIFGMQIAAVLPILSKTGKLGVTQELGLQGRSKLISGLKSRDPVLSYSAHLASFIISETSPQNQIPGLSRFLKPKLDHPDRNVRIWTGWALSKMLPPEDAWEMVLKGAESGKSHAGILTLLKGLRYVRTENREAFEKQLPEMIPRILKSGDKNLISSFAGTLGSLNLDGTKLKPFLKDADILFTEALLDDFSFGHRIRSSKDLNSEIFRIIVNTFERGDRTDALRVYIKWIQNNTGFFNLVRGNQKESDRKFLLETELFLEKSLKFAFAGKEEKLGVEILGQLFDGYAAQLVGAISKQNGGTIPLFVQNYVPTALTFVLDSETGPYAIDLLRHFLADVKIDNITWKISDYPELKESIESAVNAVLEEGTLSNKLPLLSSLAALKDARAVTTLTKLITDDMVPDDLFQDVMNNGFSPYAHQTIQQVGDNTLVNKEVVDYLVWVVKEKDINSIKYKTAFSKLTYLNGFRDEFLEACKAGLAKGDFDTPVFCLYNAVSMDQYVQHGKGERPGWFTEAGKMGQSVMKHPKAGVRIKNSALKLYILTLSQKDKQKLESFLTDAQSPLDVKVTAADRLFVLCPKTKLFQKALEKYDTLKPELKVAYAKSAARSPEAEKATDLVIKVLEDTTITGTAAWRIRDILTNLDLPYSQELVNVLIKKKKDRSLEWEVKQALKKLNKKKPVF